MHNVCDTRIYKRATEGLLADAALSTKIDSLSIFHRYTVEIFSSTQKLLETIKSCTITRLPTKMLFPNVLLTTMQRVDMLLIHLDIIFYW